MRKFTGAWEVRGGLNGASNMVAKDMEGNTKPSGNDMLIVTVGRGTVNGYEPFVSGRPISGTAADGRALQQGQPQIKGKLEYDEFYRCYVCIKIKVDLVTGKMATPPTEDDLTIVVSKGTRLAHDYGRAYWLHPIAVYSAGGVLAQVAYFDYMHYTSNSSRYHYFAAI